MTTDLIKKLEALTGPDREMDAMLYCFQNGHTYSRRYGNDYAMWVKGVPHEVKIIDMYLDKFTFSVDAAIALAERVLPNFRYAIEKRTSGIVLCWVSDSDYEPCIPVINKSLAIALCIAILKAKEVSPLVANK